MYLLFCKKLRLLKKFSEFCYFNTKFGFPHAVIHVDVNLLADCVYYAVSAEHQSMTR